MNNRKIISKILLVCLTLFVFIFGAYVKVPDGKLSDGITDEFSEVSVETETLSGEQSVSLKQVRPMKLMPVGAAVGIHIQTNGLMVLGTSEISTITGEKVHPAENIVKSGDYILQVNGQNVSNTSQMTDLLTASGGERLKLKLLRDGNIVDLWLNPAQTGENEYKVGIWVRDDTQGIGTLSFIDEKNRFAALGHGVTDIDTGYMIDICGGGLYPANVYAVIKGVSEAPGEMVGHILYGKKQKFAVIKGNTSEGIYGILEEGCEYTYDESKAVEVGLKEEMHVGAAVIRCQIDGVIDDYKVWISGIDYNGNNKNKDFVIEVKDERLLAATGGIIQGMSGSPVIQEGKLVGVVTHVFLNNAAKGYGIFIEEMLSQSQKVFAEN